MATRTEVIGPLLWVEEVDQFAGEAPQAEDGPLAGFAEYGLVESIWEVMQSGQNVERGA